MNGLISSGVELKRKLTEYYQIWSNYNLKYVGVQSWKAVHLPTLEIRVEQKRNRAKNGGTEPKMGGIKKKNNCCHGRESNPGPVDNWTNVCFDKSDPLEDTV